MLSTLSTISFNLYNIHKTWICFLPFDRCRSKNRSVQVTCPRSHRYKNKQCQDWTLCCLIPKPLLFLSSLTLRCQNCLVYRNASGSVSYHGTLVSTMGLEFKNLSLALILSQPTWKGEMFPHITIREMDPKWRSFLSHFQYTIYTVLLLKYQVNRKAEKNASQDPPFSSLWH